MKLAINGGKSVRIKKLAGGSPPGKREVAAMARAAKDFLCYGGGVDTRKPSKHYFGREFEENFTEYHDAKYGVVVSNGTVGIAVALRALGVGWGDEVLFQPYTCFANVEPVIQVGATPVFVDIDPETCCMSPEQTEKKISSRTKAIVAIHWGGRPADMDSLKRIASRHGVALVEDACVAQGAEWKGKKIGALGDIGVFSFGWGKAMSCGEGGIIVTNKRSLADRCFALRDRGRNVKGKAVDIGWNCRVSEILSAFLIARLKAYPALLKKRWANVKYLKKKLSNIDGIRLLAEDTRITCDAHCYFILRFMENEFGCSRDAFIKAAAAEGVSFGGPRYPVPLCGMEFFEKGGVMDRYMSGIKGYKHRSDYELSAYPATGRAYRKEVIWLPHGCLQGSRRDMDDIASVVVKIRENVDELRKRRP